MCLSTGNISKQASDYLFVSRFHRVLGRSKKRLYIGLYARGSVPKMSGGEDEYHWAFLAGPKQYPRSGSGHIMYHVKDELVVSGEPARAEPKWEYVKDADRGAMLLVRILVGKIQYQDRLEQALKHVPLRIDDPNWNCVLWTGDAYKSIAQDGQASVSGMPDWESVRHTAMWYVGQKKRAHRFDGRKASFVFDPEKPATWDMLGDKEIIP